MITSRVSYYVWKMRNLQTIGTPKKATNNQGLELNSLLTQEYSGADPAFKTKFVEFFA